MKLIIKELFDLTMLQYHYLKKSIGQQFVNYLGTKYYNSMPFSIKKNIIYINYKHNNVKKIIEEWLFVSLNIT